MAAIPGIIGIATGRQAVGSWLVIAGLAFVWLAPVVFPIFVFSIVMSLYHWGLAILFLPIALVIAALTPARPPEETPIPIAPWLAEMLKNLDRK